MNKTKKFVMNIALSSLSYFRMVVVVCSLVAWAEREWVGLVLALVCFGISTTLLNKVIDMPSDESLANLAEAIEQLKEGERD